MREGGGVTNFLVFTAFVLQFCAIERKARYNEKRERPPLHSDLCMAVHGHFYTFACPDVW